MATAVALVLGSMAALALQRFRFFGRDTVSCSSCCRSRCGGGHGHRARQRVPPMFGIELGMFSLVVSHATFCMVTVFNNAIARLRRLGGNLEEASMDLGAGTFRTFWSITLPMMRSALLAGALLSFALSFDEIIVTTFTAGQGIQTLPIWIYQNCSGPTRRRWSTSSQQRSSCSRSCRSGSRRSSPAPTRRWRRRGRAGSPQFLPFAGPRGARARTLLLPHRPWGSCAASIPGDLVNPFNPARLGTRTVPALLVAGALVCPPASVGTAGALITGKDIKDNTITAADIANRAIGKQQQIKHRRPRQPAHQLELRRRCPEGQRRRHQQLVPRHRHRRRVQEHAQRVAVPRQHHGCDRRSRSRRSSGREGRHGRARGHRRDRRDRGEGRPRRRGRRRCQGCRRAQGDKGDKGDTGETGARAPRVPRVTAATTGSTARRATTGAGCHGATGAVAASGSARRGRAG